MSDAAHSAGTAGSAALRSRLLSLVLHLLLIGASIIMLYPLFWMLASSFKPENEIFGSISLWPSHVDTSAYLRGWTGLKINFGHFFWNSLIISVLCVVGNVVSCSLPAFPFPRLAFRARDFWFVP